MGFTLKVIIILSIPVLYLTLTSATAAHGAPLKIDKLIGCEPGKFRAGPSPSSTGPVGGSADWIESKYPYLNKQCNKCHDFASEHPTKIRPRRIKGGRKQFRLAGGLLTCVTCHRPHGGNKDYFMWRKEPEICNPCHEL